jgi:hypothetical protein
VLASSRAKVQAFIERCAAIDWRLPSRDARRMTAAYQRWQVALGLARPVRLISDPLELPASMFSGMDDAWDSITPIWPSATGAALLRAMWPTLSPRTAPPASSPEWDIAIAWARAFTRSRTSAREVEAQAVAGLRSMIAAVSRFAGFRRANRWAMVLLDTPLLGLFDPPSRIASIACDLLAASDNDRVWEHLVALEQIRKIARALGIRTAGLNTPPRRDDLVDAIIRLYEPMVEACESGAFAHVLNGGELVVLASPPIWTDGRRLHRENGPAIAWPETKVYAWKGSVVPERFIMQPNSARPDDIRLVSSGMARRSLIDLYASTHGYRRCMQDFGGVIVHEDATGRLWSVNPDPPTVPPQFGEMKIVEVMNGTTESDGSRKTYWLNVPHYAQRAQEAVAWTYGMTSSDYCGLVVRT